MIDLEATSGVHWRWRLGGVRWQRPCSSSAATTGGLSRFAAGGLSLTATVLSAAAGLSGAACAVGAVDGGRRDGWSATAGVASCAAGVRLARAGGRCRAVLCLAIAPVTESSPVRALVTRE